MRKGKAIRVILTNDHSVMHIGIHRFLEKTGDVRFVAEVHEGSQDLRAIEKHSSYNTILDIYLQRLLELR